MVDEGSRSGHDMDHPRPDPDPIRTSHSYPDPDRIVTPRRIWTGAGPPSAPDLDWIRTPLFRDEKGKEAGGVRTRK